MEFCFGNGYRFKILKGKAECQKEEGSCSLVEGPRIPLLICVLCRGALKEGGSFSYMGRKVGGCCLRFLYLDNRAYKIVI